jgi:Holliday junction resolvase RusA-like endonuclease
MQRGPELARIVVPGRPAGAGSKTAITVTRGRGGPIVWRSGPKIVGDGQIIGVPMLNYTHASKKTEPWMKAVERAAAVVAGSAPPLDGPLWLDVFFYEHRPSTHYLHRKTGRVLRPDAPAYPDATEQHDVDKLRRAISDSLKNAHLIADDKRIIGGEQWKDFVESMPDEVIDGECAVIRLGRMDHATAEDAGLTTPAPDGQVTLV